MKKNIIKSLILLLVFILGLGKILIDNNKNIQNKEKISKIVTNVESEYDIKKDKSKNSENTTTKTENKNYEIDYNHIIGGDENFSGKVTGGHTILRGEVRIVKKIGEPAFNGVYKATVEIKNRNGEWKEKTSNGGVNTMFPENWNEERVIDEINSAWENRKDYNGKDSNMWQGKSKSNVLIRGYKTPRITAYPVFERGR
ncbi:MAG: EndoU domain-containing protein [Leptotrichiaceae bacterium]|nr:EndoU domain-containing protein [Leptotrichiaceae bacterium]MBP6281200.1 EndoU domain-containing protein [Leptotrichiaceae bacterium]MBP7100550.1 EndoU domain-containing protein [Leptotrichiaceae bacterium]MBP7739743.1 EndoU domain-containing protein [Leptotrichiaceae bacterium]MBP9630186.1 EndoU domain-containing protein [Leptotrichiaceae bacterium]